MTYNDFWEYPDKKQKELLEIIIAAFILLEDNIQALIDRFPSLEGELNKAQLERLHHDIKQYKENNYKDSQILMLYMQDLNRRLHIKRDLAFKVLLLNLFVGHYNWLFFKTKKIYFDIYAEKYQQYAGKETNLPSDIFDELLPTGISPKSMIETEALYRAGQLFKIIIAIKLRGDPADINSPNLQSEMIKAKNALLKRSKDGGYHGVLDTIMTNIVGKSVMQAIKDSGSKTYTFHAVIDDRTTPACRDLNGRTFYVSDMQLGYNVPPISFYLDSGTPIPHPCRSWISINE